jgi:hypothetical protein
MRWRFWRRREPSPNGHSAAVAKHVAEDRLREQRARWPEVHQAGDRFAALVEQALKGGRP